MMQAKGALKAEGKGLLRYASQARSLSPTQLAATLMHISAVALASGCQPRPVIQGHCAPAIPDARHLEAVL